MKSCHSWGKSGRYSMTCFHANTLVQMQTHKQHMTKQSRQVTHSNTEKQTLTSRCWLWQRGYGCYSPLQPCWWSLCLYWSLCPPDTQGQTERWRELRDSTQGRDECSEQGKRREETEHFSQDRTALSPLVRSLQNEWCNQVGIPYWLHQGSLLQIRHTSFQSSLDFRRAPSWHRQILLFRFFIDSLSPKHICFLNPFNPISVSSALC